MVFTSVYYLQVGYVIVQSIFVNVVNHFTSF